MQIQNHENFFLNQPHQIKGALMNYDDAILSTHPSYDDRYIQWITCRDTYDGERAIKAIEHREEYLPRLGGQEGRDY